MTRRWEPMVLLEVINRSSLTRFRKRRWHRIEQDLGSTGICIHDRGYIRNAVGVSTVS